MFSRASVSRFFLNVLFFIFALMLLSFICRLVFIADTGFLNGAVGARAESGDVFRALFGGARYDGRIIAPAAVFYGFLYFALSKWRRRAAALTVFASVCGFALIFLSVCDSAYYEIYGDTFNSIILGLIYDDREAIFKTGLSGDYNIIFRSLLVVISTGFFAFMFYKALKRLAAVRIEGTVPAFVLSASALYCTALLTASTWDFKGGSLDYLVTPPKNAVLRKATPGALRDIFVVYSNYKSLKGGSFENYVRGGG